LPSKAGLGETSEAVAASLLIATVTAPIGANLLNYGAYGRRDRGYYGTPSDGGPQHGSGGGDQYGYSYARQAPSYSYCRY
jgi:hypothetical protein